MSHRSNRTVALTTLGCKVNQADSDGWLQQFVARGYDVVDFSAVADAYVVNTCSVTHVADRKSRQMLRQARRQNPAALVVATGCYASVAPDEVARMVEVDLVVGDREKPRLVELVHERLEGDGEQPLEALAGALRVFGPRHRGFVKISDGCNKLCAFCIVPYARGRERSAEADGVVAHVRELVRAGYQEIVLTAVHMGTYGHDLNPPTSLDELVRRVLDETDVRRLRLSSIEPEDFDERILDRWSSPRLCRHFHLALDSGCDATLRRMRRRYLAADYRRLLDAIRSAVPGVAITTDVMVGFPGETEDEFESSRQFVSEAQFAGIHVFPYSARRRTAAAKLPDQVSPEEKHRRTDVMLAIASESARDFRRRFVGKTLPTLFEGRSNGSPDQAPNWDGLTDNYLRVRVTAPGQLDNTILETRIVEVADDCVLGEIAEPIPVDGASPPERRTWTRLPLTSASR